MVVFHSLVIRVKRDGHSKRCHKGSREQGAIQFISSHQASPPKWASVGQINPLPIQAFSTVIRNSDIFVYFPSNLYLSKQILDRNYLLIRKKKNIYFVVAFFFSFFLCVCVCVCVCMCFLFYFLLILIISQLRLALKLVYLDSISTPICKNMIVATSHYFAMCLK